MGRTTLSFRARAVGFALLLAGAPAASALASTAAPADTGLAGSEKCIECHEDQILALSRTEHGRSAFGLKSTRGCETCHGSMTEHLANPKNRKFDPPDPRKLDPEQQSENCRSCHQGDKQMHWDAGTHGGREIGCLDCHSVHDYQSDHGQLRGTDEPDTCYRCHKEIRAQFRKPSHHPVREGELGCTDCHNPHGSTNDKMLKAATTTEQCYECHTEKRGPFLWEHAPVREDCTNCHTPHGSNHQKLQITSTPYLCQQCHANTRHPGTLYDATTLPGAARQSNREFNRSCINCHQAIHGSNHPSGPYLGR